MKKITKEITIIVGLIAFGVIISGLLRYLESYQSVYIPKHSFAYVIVFVGWIILLFPVSELISIYLNKFRPPAYKKKSLNESEKLIGRLERTIILVFYLAGSLEGIAFLVVAKTIYRFGVLRGSFTSNNKANKKEDSVFAVSQYIILGSFLSYTTAILGGVLINLILDNLGLSL